MLSFPHAGGAAHRYHALASCLRSATLVPHDYPGHGRRAREPLEARLEALARDALRRHRALLAAGGYALLGHSMGARVALALAGLCAREGLPGPRALVACGSEAPGTEREPLHRLGDDAMLEELAALGGLPASVGESALLREFFLPVLRADLEALETAPAPERPIAAPIVVVHGRGEDIEPEALRGWADFTSGGCAFVEVDGGHFFPQEAPEIAALAIDDALGAQLGAPSE